ncbi:hypothetical protein DMB65_09650 [Flavobacterium cheongpyeongense]|uniref:Uncharacterized protein n=1 Tax=Flavobacterium cheongpyeongense TaxID=2212651 RepID=A0A2V4BQ00_9FLAO|nr:hypothetical protein [Flavobacterium cheongpyeongense]PXY40837.1 hypothetical protein DMB65_09650 [Flavobacterium cheongpyeongense]
MKKKISPYLQVMEYCLSFLKKLSDEEIAKIENGDLVIQFDLIEKKQNLKQKKDSITFSTTEIIDFLNTVGERDEAMKYLDSLFISRLSLEEILRKLDYPHTKKDNLEKLKQKIIEATIGFRLRSEAIQGKSDSSRSDFKDNI